LINQSILFSCNTTAATGTGPVDAAYVAVTKALGIDGIRLLEFAVSRSVTEPVSG